MTPRIVDEAELTQRLEYPRKAEGLSTSTR
jgi:hypothetical protein